MHPIRFALLVLAPLVVGALEASGQELCWLIPERFHSSGDGVQRVRWIRDLQDLREPGVPGPGIEWMLVRAAGRQRNLHDLTPAADGGILVEPLVEGQTLLGVDSPARMATLGGRELHSLVRHWVRDEVCRRRADALRDTASVAVRLTESASTLMQVGSTPGVAGTALGKTAQAAELRLLFDPTALEEPGDVAFRVYVEGSAAARQVVEVRRGPPHRPREVVTDATGHGRVRIDRSGLWRLAFVGVVPPEDDARAPWRIASSTLCFEVVFAEDER